MLGWLVGFLSSFLSNLADMLPNDPFTEVVAGLSTIDTALGWLNWLMPVSQCLGLFLAWLSVAVIWSVTSYLLDKAMGTVEGVIS